MDYTDTSIDKWTGEWDEDYCYSCQKFVEADYDGKCPICEATIDFGTDEYSSSLTAKTTISDAPSVSSDGDIWGRSGGYTWGGSTTWNKWGGSSLSGMWSGGFSVDTGDAARMLRHKRHIDSLCKVVDPTVNHTLSFGTAKTGYTNMNSGQIVIDGTLLKGGDDKLDVVSGLAIHEKLHLVHTKPLTKWENEFAFEEGMDEYEVELLHSIGNAIEDEYIEKQLSKDCAGFVQYIVATKDYYFNEKVKDMLDKPNANPYLDLMNTMLAFIRYPKNINLDRKKRHSKHIQFFGRALIGALEDRQSVIKAVKTMYAYMKKVAEKMEKEMPDDSKGDLAKKMKKLRETIDGSEMSDADWKKIKDKLKKDMEAKDSWGSGMRKLLHKDRDSYKNICGATEYDKMGKDITEALAEEIRALEDTDYDETDLGKSDCLHPKQTKITWRNALPDSRHIEIYKNDSKFMKPQTNMLKRKIQLYGNTERFTIRNQKRGKIDKRVLHRIPMGRQDLFKSTIIKEDKPLDVCLLVDESGSMGGLMQYARQSCISLKEALEDNEMLDLWVMGHTADGERWHNEPNTTNMTVYHSPKMTDRPMAMGCMRAKTENRDGNAILAAAGRVREETQAPMSEKLMIIFSDGSPAALGYGGSRGIEHVRKVVKQLEAQGWSIIQVGFGGAHYQERMFKNHIYVGDVSQLATKVSKILKKVIKI